MGNNDNGQWLERFYPTAVAGGFCSFFRSNVACFRAVNARVPGTSSSGRRRSTEQMTWLSLIGGMGTGGIGTLQGKGNNTAREGKKERKKKPFPTSQGRSPKLCTVGAPPASGHGRNDGTWKHEMINGMATKRKGNRLPLCPFHIAISSLASRRMAHRIASWLRACVRACVAGRLGGHTISSASVTASKIAAVQNNRAYLPTMQSSRMTMHRGLDGASSV